MKELLKRNWFVGVVLVVFAAFTLFFVYDQNKDTLKGKTVNGSGVVFSLDGEDTTADDLYEKYYTSYGQEATYALLQRKLLDVAVPTNKELENQASNMGYNYRNYYQQSYGDYGETYLEQQVQAMGMSSIEEYCLYTLKQQKLDSDHILENLDKYWTPFAELKHPRIVYHALIKMEDVENPTEEEQAKLDEAKKAWDSGEYTFEQFAAQFSDDTSSAVNGGYIGYIDEDSYSSYVTEFVDAALKTNAGEYSAWTKSTYGYHLLYVSSESPEDCLEEMSCIQQIITLFPNMESSLIWNKIQELNVEYPDEEFETFVKESLGVNADGVVEDEIVLPETETEGQ